MYVVAVATMRLTLAFKWLNLINWTMVAFWKHCCRAQGRTTIIKFSVCCVFQLLFGVLDCRDQLAAPRFERNLLVHQSCRHL